MEGNGRQQNEISWSESITILLRNLMFFLAVDIKNCNPFHILGQESQIGTGVLQFST